MYKLKTRSKTVSALLVTLVFAAGVPVSALEGSTSTTVGEPTKPASTAERKQPRPAVEKQQLAAEEKAAARAEKKPEQRKKVCEARKKGLTQKFSNIVANSRKTQLRIDGIYDKALAYKTTNNLQPANFASLSAAADSAKATSLASIAALEAQKPTLDCNNVSVASDVAAFKTLAQTTRDDLKDYRVAVKAVLKSLKELKPAKTGSTAQ